jgi:hypothetical protein
VASDLTTIYVHPCQQIPRLAQVGEHLRYLDRITAVMNTSATTTRVVTSSGAVLDFAAPLAEVATALNLQHEGDAS